MTVRDRLVERACRRLELTPVDYLESHAPMPADHPVRETYSDKNLVPGSGRSGLGSVK